MKIPITASLLLLSLLGVELLGQSAATLFVGVPTFKVEEMAVTRAAYDLDRKSALGFRCVISKIGDRYYWASRDNALLTRKDEGAFITFTSVSTNGYVRVIAPKLKDAASLLSEAETKFDYVEHLVIGLRNVTYWGRMESPADSLYPPARPNLFLDPDDLPPVSPGLFQ